MLRDVSIQQFHGYDPGLKERLLGGIRLSPPGVPPAIQLLRDAVALPGYRGLYDARGSRIDAGHWRTLSEDAPELFRRKLHSRTPQSIDVPGQIAKFDQKVVFAGMLIPQYGHFLIDTMARLWAADLDPDLPLLFLKHPDDWVEYPDYVRTIFDALGLSSRIVTIDEPTLFREVVCPAPTFEYRSKVFSIADRPHRRVADRLVERPSPRWARPVYLSRSGLLSNQRKFAVELELEEEVQRRGVDIARPETLELAEQIALFEQAPVILGTVGSAFHTALFSRSSGNALGLLTWGRGIENYLLVDSIKSHQSHYIQSLTGIEEKFTLDVERSLRLLESAGLLSSRAQIPGVSMVR